MYLYFIFELSGLSLNVLLELWESRTKQSKGYIQAYVLNVNNFLSKYA